MPEWNNRPAGPYSKEKENMSEETPEYKTVEKGLKGTDNCPRCGRAMERCEALVCATNAEDHTTIIAIRRHGPKLKARGSEGEGQ